MSNRIKLLGLAAVAAITVAIVWNSASGPTGPTPSSDPSASRPSPTAALPAEPKTATYLDQVLGAAGPGSPTGDRAQSKLWIAGGAWWAAMVEPTTLQYHIYELVDGGKSWRDTGTLIDERRGAQPDCLWDGTHLYVVSAATTKTASGAARLIRYSFDAKNRRFTLDRDFPIPITATGVDSMVLAQDTTGELWTTYVADDGQVTVNRTLGDDLHWGTPFALPAPGSLVTAADVASVVAFGPGRIGVMWGSRSSGAYYLATHLDGDPDETWAKPEIAIQARGIASGQLKVVAAADGRLYAAVSTALDDDPASPSTAPQTLLLTRTTSGTWSSVLVSQIRDQNASPLVAVDGTTGIVYVMATTPKRGGAINFKRGRVDLPSFTTGAGSPLITDPAATLASRGTSTKGAISPETGLVVLAYDPATTRYLHGVADLGGGVAAGPLPAAGASNGPQLVFRDGFDPWKVGSTPNIGWELRATDPVGSFTVQGLATSKTNRIGSLIARDPGHDVRACKSFPTVTTGDLTVDVRVRLARTGPSDAVLTEVRGEGVEAATVRFGRNGTFAYFRGQTKIRTLVAVRPRVWYRSIVVVHLTSRTFDWTLLNGTGRRLIAVQNIPWRDTTTLPMDKVCLRTPTGGPGIGLNWDDISVIR
ncbi:MAG: hypothetical protein QOF11_1343 [Chloroflexota bacterium]|nr:hypothetical protein [Chloroflexota bacterium]